MAKESSIPKYLPCKHEFITTDKSNVGGSRPYNNLTVSIPGEAKKWDHLVYSKITRGLLFCSTMYSIAKRHSMVLIDRNSTIQR